MGLASKINQTMNVVASATNATGVAGQSYGAPRPPGQQTPYGAPQQPNPYGIPQQQNPYGAPPQQAQNSYGAPSQNPYGVPGQQQQQPYGQNPYAPPQQLQNPYGQPQQPYPVRPGQPQQQPPYGAPQNPYGTPVQQQPPYGAPPQNPYGAPPQQGYGGAAPVAATPTDTNALARKLQSIIAQNGIQNFYDAQRFATVMQKVATVNFDSIAQQWNISKELAYDLVTLAFYDIVFYCDDSGSMRFEENGERITDLKFILSKVAAIATMFDDDGIVVRFMNSNVNGDGLKSAQDVESLFGKIQFNGMTPLGTNLDRKIIQPLVIGQARSNSMAKPVLVIAITDGEPSGENKDYIIQVIRRAKDELSATRYGPGALAVEIAQVGKDAATQRFLEKLDNDAHVGNMIDCTSYYELEAEEFARKGVSLTPELWLLKMCVGAVDRSYDEKD